MRRWVLALGLWLAVGFGAPALAQEIHAPEATVSLEDPLPVPAGFATVTGPYLDVSGDPRHLPVMTELAQYGSRALPRLADELGVPIGNKVQVLLADDDAQFRALQPGRIPEWADATAWPERGTIFLRAPGARGLDARPIERVFDHELVHVLLGRVFAPHQPPLWLQEGLARAYAGEHDPNDAKIIAQSYLRKGPYTLEELHTAFPRDIEGAQLAYAQSADFVDWIRAKYGPAAVPTLVRELAAGHTMDAAIYAATNDTLEQVDAAWRADLKSTGPLWVWAATANDVIWGGVGIAAAMALVAHRRRLRRRLDAMAADEAARRAALASFWRHPVPPVH
jgi:hypothetical protein